MVGLEIVELVDDGTGQPGVGAVRHHDAQRVAGHEAVVEAVQQETSLMAGDRARAGGQDGGPHVLAP